MSNHVAHNLRSVGKHWIPISLVMVYTLLLVYWDLNQPPVHPNATPLFPTTGKGAVLAYGGGAGFSLGLLWLLKRTSLSPFAVYPLSLLIAALSWLVCPVLVDFGMVHAAFLLLTITAAVVVDVLRPSLISIAISAVYQWSRQKGTAFSLLFLVSLGFGGSSLYFITVALFFPGPYHHDPQGGMYDGLAILLWAAIVGAFLVLWFFYFLYKGSKD